MFKACYTHSTSTAGQHKHTAETTLLQRLGCHFRLPSFPSSWFYFIWIYWWAESEGVRGGFSSHWSESARVRGFRSSPNWFMHAEFHKGENGSCFLQVAQKHKPVSLELQRLFLSSFSRGTEWCKGWLADCVALNKWIAHLRYFFCFFFFFFLIFFLSPLRGFQSRFGACTCRAAPVVCRIFPEPWRPDNPTAKGSLNKRFWVKKPFFLRRVAGAAGARAPSPRAQRHPAAPPGAAATALCRQRKPGSAPLPLMRADGPPAWSKPSWMRLLCDLICNS